MNLWSNICQPKNNICAFQNKAADFQKENQVLVLKELIGSLGSNKTEHAIITVSIAAPVIQDIVNNVDQMVNVESKQSSHKNKFLKKMSW
jgi:hypothetical protein